MTRVERETLYLETFQKLKDQAAERVPPKLFNVWCSGAASMCLALAQTDDEVSDISYKFMEEFFLKDFIEI